MTFINPLDLEMIFSNILAGSAAIFGILFLLFLTGFGAKFRMTGMAFLIMLPIAIVMMAANYFSYGLYVFFLSIIGLVGIWIIGRIFQR